MVFSRKLERQNVSKLAALTRGFGFLVPKVNSLAGGLSVECDIVAIPASVSLCDESSSTSLFFWARDIFRRMGSDSSGLTRGA